MPGMILNEAEKVYIIHGIQDNIRSDGRKRMDYRMITFETDYIETLNGSCMLKVGNTKLVAGVKAELGAPSASAPDRGRIEVNIESTPHANVDFEGRGGDDFAADISKLITNYCNDDKFIDLKSLCILEGQQAWVIYVDIMIFGYAGNYIDAASFATKAALFNTKIQTATVKCEDGKEPEIELSEDAYDAFSLDVTNLPILMTMYRVGGEFFVDADEEEESCCLSKIALAVSPTEVVTMKQLGNSGSIHMASIHDAIEMGQEMGKTFQKQFTEALQIEKDVSKRK